LEHYVISMGELLVEVGNFVLSAQRRE
jgi:hypothetical protein